MKRLTRARQPDSLQVTDFELGVLRAYRKVRDASWTILLGAVAAALGTVIATLALVHFGLWPK